MIRRGQRAVGSVERRLSDAPAPADVALRRARHGVETRKGMPHGVDGPPR